MKADKSNGVGAIERETGIAKETLRIWERRYGFPQPLRSESGDRVYQFDDVKKLRLIKRLLDRGVRPAQIVNKPFEELEVLARTLAPPDDSPQPSETQLPNLNMLKAGQISNFRDWLMQEAMHRTLPDFILSVVQPLCDIIGAAWERSDISVSDEHLLTQQVENALRHKIVTTSFTRGGARVILATLPGERHGLGLLMLEGMLAKDDMECFSLGLETPITDLLDVLWTSALKLWRSPSVPFTHGKKPSKGLRNCAQHCRGRLSSGPAAGVSSESRVYRPGSLFSMTCPVAPNSRRRRTNNAMSRVAGSITVQSYSAFARVRESDFCARPYPLL